MGIDWGSISGVLAYRYGFDWIEHSSSSSSIRNVTPRISAFSRRRKLNHSTVLCGFDGVGDVILDVCLRHSRYDPWTFSSPHNTSEPNFSSKTSLRLRWRRRMKQIPLSALRRRTRSLGVPKQDRHLHRTLNLHLTSCLIARRSHFLDYVSVGHLARSEGAMSRSS